MKENYSKDSLKKRISGLIGIVVALMALSTTIVAATPYTVGDVFVGVGNGFIKQFTPTGVLKNTLNTGTGCAEDSGMAFDSAGNLFASVGFGTCPAPRVVKFDNMGNLIGPFGPASAYTTTGNSAESVVIDAAQNVYAGQPDGNHQLLKFSPTGTLLNAFSPAIEDRGTDWIDLAADQCTMYYTSEGKEVKRFNVCTNTQMSDFNTAPLPGSNDFALRILSTGEVIVADTDRVVLLDASGNLEKTYAAPADFNSGDFLFALNKDPDGTHFWTASFSGGKVYEYDFANTAGPVFEFDPAKLGYAVSGLAIFGEPTAAKPPAGSIAGTKFNDLNGDGIRQKEEPGLANWIITLTNDTGVTINQTTASDGSYNFTDLTDGNYTVGEVIQPGWIQTAPAVSATGSATYTVNISGGNSVVGKDFGNFQLGSVSGTKFEDLNANKVRDTGEAGLAGWQITITGKDTIENVDVTQTTTTDANGNYNFTGLTAGTYTISETLKDGWVQTAPATGTYTVTITSGAAITGQDFGNFHKGDITGGGWISIPKGDTKATFGLVGHYPDSSNTAQGSVEYQDHVANLNIKSTEIDSVATTTDKKKGVITGIAQVNGAGSYPFVVYVEDNGEPGKGVDVFQITLPTYPYSSGTPLVLSSGNIQIHS